MRIKKMTDPALRIAPGWKPDSEIKPRVERQQTRSHKPQFKEILWRTESFSVWGVNTSDPLSPRRLLARIFLAPWRGSAWVGGHPVRDYNCIYSKAGGSATREFPERELK